MSNHVNLVVSQILQIGSIPISEKLKQGWSIPKQVYKEMVVSHLTLTIYMRSNKKEVLVVSQYLKTKTRLVDSQTSLQRNGRFPFNINNIYEE